MIRNNMTKFFICFFRAESLGCFLIDFYRFMRERREA